MDTATYVSQEELASAAAEVGVDLVRYCQLQCSRVTRAVRRTELCILAHALRTIRYSFNRCQRGR